MDKAQVEAILRTQLGNNCQTFGTDPKLTVCLTVKGRLEETSSQRYYPEDADQKQLMESAVQQKAASLGVPDKISVSSLWSDRSAYWQRPHGVEEEVEVFQEDYFFQCGSLSVHLR